MWIRFVNDNYYIRTRKGFLKVKGMPISIEDIELDLFLHKSEKGIAISEGTSGVRISGNHRNRKSAIKFVRRIIAAKGEHVVKKNIQRHIGSRMLSPRYRFIVNPTRQCGSLNE